MTEILEHLLAAESARKAMRRAFKRIGEIAAEQLAENEAHTRSIKETIEHLTTSGQYPQTDLDEETQTLAETMTNNGSANKARTHYATWEEYEEQGIRIPEVRPANPVELRDIINQYPMPKSPRKAQELEVKRRRNLAASHLMAERLEDGKFMVLDFAELLQAAGLHDSSVEAVKKTLLRHLRDCPDFQETGEPGEMQLVVIQQNKPVGESTDTGSEDMSPGHTRAPTPNGIAAAQPV